jgi:hypothetical protein
MGVPGSVGRLKNGRMGYVRSVKIPVKTKTVESTPVKINQRSKIKFDFGNLLKKFNFCVETY